MKLPHKKLDKLSFESFRSSLRLEGEDLLLRELDLKSDNLDEYLTWMRDKDSNPYIKGVDQNLSIEQLKDYVTAKNNDPMALLLGIFLKETGKHIGNLKFQPIDFNDNSAWIGILIGNRDYRGRGFAQASIKLGISHLGSGVGIKNYFLGVDLANSTAIRTYKELGFSTFGKLDENSITMQLIVD